MTPFQDHSVTIAKESTRTMSGLPQHKTLQVSDFGVRIRRTTPGQIPDPVQYAHQDDYYVFGAVLNGTCRVSIDFREYSLQSGEAVFVRPGQVHRFMEADHLEAFLLIADCSVLNDEDKYILDKYSLTSQPYPIKPKAEQLDELLRIADIIAERLDTNSQNSHTRNIIINLSAAFAGIFAEAIRTNDTASATEKRSIELTLKFRKILDAEICRNRQPSYYASRLNISPAYLNEVVKSTTGLSVGQCIRNETILRAKRLLIHSNYTVQDIADMLGMNDSAYFSKLFTKTTGISPTQFRKRNLG